VQGVATELTALIDVDFLPAAYRQRSVNRRAYAWRVVAAAAMVAAFAGTALWQHNHHGRVRQALAEVEAQYTQASLQAAKLTEVGSQLQTQHKMAQLLTLLRHRWPRTQVLAVAMEQLPDSVTLIECHLGHEVLPSTAPSAIAVPQPNAPPPDQSTRRANDVQRLLREYNQRRYFLAISGHASDAATMHAYLARLGTSPLFAQVDLKSLENVPADQSQGKSSPTVHFEVRAVLRAPHDEALQPEGSAAPEQAIPSPLASRGN
jgi:hypothetical protein